MEEKGLILIENFITEEEEVSLIETLDSLEWSNALKRRVQQYGRTYDYSNRILGKAPEIPDIIKVLGENIPHLSKKHQQVIVNEYLPGQGISAHTDHKYHFGDVIATISLGWRVPMLFKNGNEEIEVLLPRRSLTILRGESRNKWTHEIKARKKDHGISRERRISITFRNVIS